MAISDKSRKLLWGRAASRCSFCRIELVMDDADPSSTSIVGEECHVVAQKPNGARWRSLPTAQVDDYANLILLCRNCHKLADDQHQTFTEDVLRRIKRNHERWVTETLGSVAELRSSGPQRRTKVHLLSTGDQVLDAVVGAHAYDFKHDELADEHEVSLVGGFLQSVQDWCELFDDRSDGRERLARSRQGGDVTPGHHNPARR